MAIHFEKAKSMNLILLLSVLLLLPLIWQTVRESDLPAVLDDEILPFFNDGMEAGSFTGQAGLRIHYRKLERPGDRAALVILPGRTESEIKYAELAYDLRNAGLSLFILDHRGQGFSDRMLPDPDKGHVEAFRDYVADLKTFMDTVVLAPGRPPVFLLGHSMGGTVAVLYTEQNPGRLQGLILSAPMMEINTGPTPAGLLFALVSILNRLGLGQAYLPGQKPYDPEQSYEKNVVTTSRARFEMSKKQVAAYPQTALGGPTIGWAKEAVLAAREALAGAHELTLPVLLLEAGNDTVVAARGIRILSEKAANCRWFVLEKARHELLMEQDPIRSAAIGHILDFLREHAPEPPNQESSS